MTNVQYMLWFLASAALITSVLTVGTLAAAGLIPRHKRAAESARADARASSPRATRQLRRDAA
jgi:hypothetical protein